MAKNQDNINERQKAFCNLYVSKEFFGNGVESYAEAYNLDLNTPKGYNTAKVNACKALTNPNILLYINSQLDAAGLNDNFVDKQLLFTITQNADFGSKVAAIREYNKLKARITENINMKVTGITVKREC